MALTKTSTGVIADNSITEDQVNGWVEATMGTEEVQAKKDAIDAQIAEKVNPCGGTPVVASTMKMLIKVDTIAVLEYVPPS